MSIAVVPTNGPIPVPEPMILVAIKFGGQVDGPEQHDAIVAAGEMSVKSLQSSWRVVLLLCLENYYSHRFKGLRHCSTDQPPARGFL